MIDNQMNRETDQHTAKKNRTGQKKRDKLTDKQGER